MTANSFLGSDLVTLPRSPRGDSCPPSWPPSAPGDDVCQLSASLAHSKPESHPKWCDASMRRLTSMSYMSHSGSSLGGTKNVLSRSDYTVDDDDDQPLGSIAEVYDVSLRLSSASSSISLSHNGGWGTHQTSSTPSVPSVSPRRRLTSAVTFTSSPGGMVDPLQVPSISPSRRRSLPSAAPVVHYIPSVVMSSGSEHPNAAAKHQRRQPPALNVVSEDEFFGTLSRIHLDCPLVSLVDHNNTAVVGSHPASSTGMWCSFAADEGPLSFGEQSTDSAVPVSSCVSSLGRDGPLTCTPPLPSPLHLPVGHPNRALTRGKQWLVHDPDLDQRAEILSLRDTDDDDEAPVVYVVPIVRVSGEDDLDEGDDDDECVVAVATVQHQSCPEVVVVPPLLSSLISTLPSTVVPSPTNCVITITDDDSEGTDDCNDNTFSVDDCPEVGCDFTGRREFSFRDRELREAPYGDADCPLQPDESI